MIGKQIISNGFGATSKYVLGKEDAELLYSNMGGANYQQLSQEFAAIARLRPNNNRACLHAVLSLPHREDDQGEVTAHESLNNNQWVEVGQRWLEEMGFTDNQYLMVRHHDTKHEHLHIVANRIRLDGDVVSDSYNFFRSEAVIRKIEQDYELEAVTPSWETHRRAPTTPELKEFERTGTGSIRLTIAELAQEAAADRPTMPEYIDRMKELGVEVKVNITRNDKVRGLSYSMGAYAFQGSDIGKDYSWNGLQQSLGVSYVQSRDFETISQGESRTNNSRTDTARTTEPVAKSDRTTEPAVNQPPAADLQSEPGKQLVETAISSIARNFGERISRKLTEQPERELATAPSGAGSKSRAVREKPAHQIDITEKLDQLGSTVHEVNAELSLQIGRNRSAGSDSRTASSTAGSSQPTASPTSGISAADISQQFEEINRIHDGIRRRRRTAAIEPVATTASFEQGANSLNATIDSLNQLNGYIAEGIKQLNAEGEGRTTQHREEIHFVRAEHDVSLASDRREDHQSGRVSGVLHGEGQNTSTPGLTGETNQGTRNSTKTNDDTSTTSTSDNTKSDEKAGSLLGIKGTKNQGQKPFNISLDAFLAILSIRQPQYHFYSSYAPSENTPEKKLADYTKTKSQLIETQKRWESSPVWEQRSSWERNLITKAFEGLISSPHRNIDNVAASISYPEANVRLYHEKTLYVRSRHSHNINYETHQDKLASVCTISPHYQQAFLPPGQQLEINHSREQQLEINQSREQQLENKIEKNQQVVEQKPKELDTTRNLESNSLNPEPATPVLPTKRLELPEDIIATRAYLDKIYQGLVTEVKQQNNLKLRDDLDVGVALFALNEGYGNNDVRRILLRSPKSQEWKHDPHPMEKFSPYKEERLAIALTFKQLEDDPKQNERAIIVGEIVEDLFKPIKYGQSQVEDNYTFKRVGNTCTVIAHDERGEVFKLNGKWIEKCNLTDNDVRQWQQISEKLKEKEQERQNKMPRYIPSPSNEQKQLEL